MDLLWVLGGVFITLLGLIAAVVVILYGVIVASKQRSDEATWSTALKTAYRARHQAEDD